MRGNGDEIGILPRFAKDLIEEIENTDFALYVTVTQIYKEWTFDLLRLETNVDVSCW